MKTGRFHILRILVTVYGLLYALQLISPFYSDNQFIFELKTTKIDATAVVFAFLVYMFGAVYSWFNRKVGGIIFMAWHFLVWVFALLLWDEAGLILMLIFPMLFPAVFLVRQWYLDNDVRYRSERRQWQLVLRLLLVNYAAIYSLIVLVHVTPALAEIALPDAAGKVWIAGWPAKLNVILSAEFVLFVAALIMSWKSERIAGALLIVWFAVLLASALVFPVFLKSGPYVFFGVVLLVQGILYLVYPFKSHKEATVAVQ